MDSQKIIEKEAVFIIGKVYSVDGRTVKIRVNKNKNHSHIIYDGKTIKNVSVGSYVKILKGFTTIIGKIEGEYIEEETFYNREYKKEETRISRFLQASLFGHYESGVFKQGIKEMPLIDNECYVLDKDEFNRLHNFAHAGEKTIQVGRLTEEPSQEIRIALNSLFASHIGIFGNTGSGKSNTLARLYNNLFETAERDFTGFKDNSTFVFIDFNGEYCKEDVLTRNKRVIKLDTSKEVNDISNDEKFNMPLSYLEDLEVLSVLLEATEKTQQPFLSRVINSKFLQDPKNFKISVEETLRTVIRKSDRNIGPGVIIDFLRQLGPYIDPQHKTTFDTLVENIETNLGQINGGAFFWERATSSKYDSNYHIYDTEIKGRLDQVKFVTDDLSNLQIRIVLTYYRQLAASRLNPEHVGPLLGRMPKRFRMLSKVIFLNKEAYSENILVLSLRNVNLEMKKVLPLMVSKYLYDKHKNELNSKQGKKKSLNIVIDEAHNILSTESQRESDSWKDYRLETFEEIIKEGRKFGVFLTIASQRPFDISPTIISQLHNYFIHRLINDNDIAAIRRAVAYLDKLSFESIPILSVGSCFIAGLATDLPIKVDIELLAKKERPDSETINLEEQWTA